MCNIEIALNRVIELKDLILYPENTHIEHESEAQALSEMVSLVQGVINCKNNIDSFECEKLSDVRQQLNRSLKFSEDSAAIQSGKDEEQLKVFNSLNKQISKLEKEKSQKDAEIKALQEKLEGQKNAFRKCIEKYTELEAKQTGIVWVKATVENIPDECNVCRWVDEIGQTIHSQHADKAFLTYLIGCKRNVYWLNENAAVPDARQEAIAFAEYLVMFNLKEDQGLWHSIPEDFCIGDEYEELTIGEVYDGFKDWQAKQKEVKNG